MLVPCFTASGYGDRMIDLFLFSIISEIYNESVDIVWKSYEGNGIEVPSWRFLDTELDNFLSMFKLPETLQLHKSPVFSRHMFNEYFGGCVSPYRLYSRMNFNISEEMYNKLIDHLKSQFSLHIPLYNQESPYTVLHLRRSDKVRSNHTDEFMIHNSELEHLDNETKLAIQSSEYKTFYIASDDPLCKQDYIQYIRSLGYTVIEPENQYNLLSSYFDTWMMFSSSCILVSMRYSNFSLFPALFKNIPLVTVLPPDRYIELGFHHHVNIRYFKDKQCSSS